MTPVPVPADLRPITALRFLAAAWVVLFHFWPDLDTGVALPLAAKGYLGVELFFILSGFILCHVYLAAAGEGRFRYGGFLWARLARVYPLHLATLVAVGLMGLGALAAGLSIEGSVLSWSSLPANLLLVHAWGFAPQAGWNHPSWSISAEWFAYLLFPAFAFVAWRLRARPWLATVGAAGLLLGLYAVFEATAGFPLTQATIRWGALRIVPCFMLGCALYLVYRRAPLAQAGWIAALAAALMLAAAWVQAWDGITVLAAGLLILALASLPNARAGWLSSRPAVYLGEISYSVYMVCAPWQMLAVNLAARLTGAEDKRLPLLVWLAVVLAIPAVAAVSYHLIERPARTWLRGLADRRSGAAIGRRAASHGDGRPKGVFNLRKLSSNPAYGRNSRKHGV